MMTTQEQCIALAEWRGWSLESTNVKDGKCWHLNGIQSEEAPPNYPEDLNACHEVEERLKLLDLQNYVFELGKITKYDISNGMLGCCIWHATAAQRTEALCRTLFPERFE